MPDRRELEELLADRPELAPAVESILSVDDEVDVWDFEDVAVDTGFFGEIVDAGVVEKRDGGYVVSDPETVRAALDADREPTVETKTTANGGATRSETDEPTGAAVRDIALGSVSEFLSSIGRLPRATGAVLGGIALYVITRAFFYADVFRDGNAILVANDPYSYRYHVDQLLATSSDPLDLSILAQIPTGEPLVVSILWWVAALFGGGQSVTGTILAWYPVVAAVLTGALVYVLGASVLDDRRVGAVAAVVLALTPAHAMRTALGFADHHPFDYLWLTVTILSLAWLVAIDDDPFTTRHKRGAGLLGVAIAGQTLAWEGSPLFLLPVAGYLAVKAPLDMRVGRPSLRSNAPVLLGVAVGAALVALFHVALGWQSAAVTAVPLLLLVGGIVLLSAVDVARRRGLSVRTLVGVELAVPLLLFVGLTLVFPDPIAQLRGGFDFLITPSGIGEKGSAFTPDNLFGLESLGLVLAFGLPVLGWGTRQAIRGDRTWLVLSVYGWWLLLLSALQLRFAAHLTPLLAVFAAVGFVWCLARYDLAVPPMPFRRASSAGASETTSDSTAPSDGKPLSGRTDAEPDATDAGWFERREITPRSAFFAVVLIALLVVPAAWQLPGAASSGTYPDRQYDTATWMAADADERGLNLTESYVLSQWGDNRFYNYVVNGESASYGFARGNYTDFVVSQDSEATYERLKDRVEYVVLDAEIPRRPNTLYHHLWVSNGRGWADGTYDAVAHFRAVYATENRYNRVFTLVPGASVTGLAEPNATVEAERDVDIPNDSFSYTQQATVDRMGIYEMTVPYPGQYEFTAGNESWTVTVPDSAVRNGSDVVGRDEP